MLQRLNILVCDRLLGSECPLDISAFFAYLEPFGIKVPPSNLDGSGHKGLADFAHPKPSNLLLGLSMFAYLEPMRLEMKMPP